MHECGLCEVNIPKETGLLHQELLYTTPGISTLVPHDFPPAFGGM